MEDTIYMSLFAPEHLARKARVLAAALGISRSELIRRAVAREVERLEKADGTTARAAMLAEATRNISAGDGQPGQEAICESVQ